MNSTIKGDYYSLSSRYAPTRSFCACILQPVNPVARASTRLTARTSARTYPITAPDTALVPILYLAAQDPNFLSEVGAVNFDQRVTRSGARTDGQAQ